MNKERLQEIIDDTDYEKLAGFARGFDDWEFNEFCVSGAIQGGGVRIGRLIQIRVKAGVAGSDMVLVRTQDGTLMRHENQSFTAVKEKYLKELNEWFPPNETDIEGVEYGLKGGEFRAAGFIVHGFEDSSEDALSFTVTTMSQ